MLLESSAMVSLLAPIPLDTLISVTVLLAPPTDLVGTNAILNNYSLQIAIISIHMILPTPFTHLLTHTLSKRDCMKMSNLLTNK